MVFIVILGILIIVLLIYMFLLARRNMVVEQTLYLPGFPSAFDGLRLFFISDIHSREIDDDMLSQVEGKADVIVIGGDLTEKNVPFTRVEKNIKKLRNLGPVIFVWGNHDYETDYRRLDALLLENRVIVLANEVQMFEQHGETLYIIGVDDVGKKRDNLPLALGGCSNGGYKIVVSHHPDITEKIAVEDAVGLVLSGHNHGGQIRLFGYGIRELGGVNKTDTYVQLVSNGYGTTRLPLRLGAPPQTHLLTLCVEK